MKKYIEFYDDGISAVDQMNDFIAENKHLKVSVISYKVVRCEQRNNERTYILVEVQE